MDKKKFLEIFETAIGIEDITHISVKVMQPNGKFEVITFGRDMFGAKYEYYRKAYDDEMKLNTFNQIYITSINFSNDVGCLVAEMFRNY